MSRALETLPETWAWVRLADVAAVVDPNPSHRNPTYVASGFPFVSTAEFTEPDGIVVDTSRRVSEQTVVEQEARCAFSQRSILFSRKGTIGKTRVLPAGVRLALLDSLCVINPCEAVDHRFLNLALRSRAVGDQVRASTRGVALKQVSVGRVRDLMIPIAPLKTQRAIVEKIDGLTAKSRRAKEALDAIPPLLERFRQSVLAAAFRGDLTKDWREQHPDVEPADQLLARIRQQRRARWEQAELAKLRAKEKDPKGGAWKESYVEPGPADSAALPEIPDGWCWATLGMLSLGFEAGRSPKAHGRPAADHEYGVLKVSAVSWGAFRPEENKALMNDKQPEPGLTVRAGDLLISRANTVQLVGAVVLVEDDYPRLMLSDKTLRVLYLPDVILPEYLVLALRASWVRALFEEDATGTSDSMRNLSQGKMQSAAVPVPPLSEQVALVATARKLLVGARTVYLEASRAIERLDDLNRAVLAKAFRGELVD